MTKLQLQFLAVACSAMALLSSQSARAGDAGGYLRLGGGASFAEDVTLDVSGSDAEMKLDTGFLADLALGYDLNRWAAVELEVGYYDNAAESVTLRNQTVHLDDTWLRGVPVMANVFFRYQNRTAFVPYIGGGAGCVFSTLGITGDTDTTEVFAYQLMAGVVYKLDEKAWIDLGYKFISNNDADYVVGGTDITSSKVRHHIIGGSVIWRF